MLEKRGVDARRRQIEQDTPVAQPDDARKMRQRQIDRVQARDQRQAARRGLRDKNADGVVGERRVEGRHRLVARITSGR